MGLNTMTPPETRAQRLTRFAMMACFAISGLCLIASLAMAGDVSALVIPTDAALNATNMTTTGAL